MVHVYGFEVPAIAWAVIAAVVAVLVVALAVVVLPPLTARVAVDLESGCVTASALLAPSKRFCASEVEEVRVVTSLSGDLKPVLRTLGIGLPGFLWGWFKLANGCKAFLAVSGKPSKLLVVLLHDGTYVVLAPKNVENLTEDFKRMGLKVQRD